MNETTSGTSSDPADAQRSDSAHTRLWRELSDLNQLHLAGLCIACNFAARQMLMLDASPRHDSVLDDETWHAVIAFPYSSAQLPIRESRRDLKQSRMFMEQALDAISGVYRGDHKVKSEDQLRRQLAKLDELMQVLDDIAAEEPPRQPYLIRQQSLSSLLLSFADVVGGLTALRKSMTGENLADGIFERLAELERCFTRMRADLSRWRDNPSQQLGTKMETFAHEVGALVYSLNTLLKDVRRECRKEGIVFYNRCGPLPD